jgi:hypothetical protein
LSLQLDNYVTLINSSALKDLLQGDWSIWLPAFIFYV